MKTTQKGSVTLLGNTTTDVKNRAAARTSSPSSGPRESVPGPKPGKNQLQIVLSGIASLLQGHLLQIQRLREQLKIPEASSLNGSMDLFGEDSGEISAATTVDQQILPDYCSYLPTLKQSSTALSPLYEMCRLVLDRRKELIAQIGEIKTPEKGNIIRKTLAKLFRTCSAVLRISGESVFSLDMLVLSIYFDTSTSFNAHLQLLTSACRLGLWEFCSRLTQKMAMFFANQDSNKERTVNKIFYDLHVAWIELRLSEDKSIIMEEIFELRRRADELTRGFEAYRAQAIVRELQCDCWKLPNQWESPIGGETGLYYLEEAIYKWRTLIRSHFPKIFDEDEDSTIEITGKSDEKTAFDWLAFDVSGYLECLMRIQREYLQFGFPRESDGYIQEGIRVARKLGYLTWSLKFLNALVQLKLRVQDQKKATLYSHLLLKGFSLDISSLTISGFSALSSSSNVASDSEDSQISINKVPSKKPNRKGKSVSEQSSQEEHEEKSRSASVSVDLRSCTRRLRSRLVKSFNDEISEPRSRAEFPEQSGVGENSSDNSSVFVEDSTQINWLERFRHTETCQCVACELKQSELYKSLSESVFTLAAFKGVMTQLCGQWLKHIGIFSAAENSTAKVLKTCCDLLKIQAPVEQNSSNLLSKLSRLHFLSDIAWCSDCAFHTAQEGHKITGELTANALKLIGKTDTVDLCFFTRHFKMIGLLSKMETDNSDLSSLEAQLSNMVLTTTKKKQKSRKNSNTSKTRCAKKSAAFSNSVQLREFTDFKHLFFHPWRQNICDKLSEATHRSDPWKSAWLLAETAGIQLREKADVIKVEKSRRNGQTDGLPYVAFRSAEEYKTELQKHLPKNWTMVQLRLTEETESIGRLWLKRISKSESDELSCFVVPLSLQQVPKMFEELQRISEENEASAKVKIRKDFWSWRRRLDGRFKELLEKIETEWFGTLKVFLAGNISSKSVRTSQSISELRAAGWPSDICQDFLRATSILSESELPDFVTKLAWIYGLPKLAEKITLSILSSYSFMTSFQDEESAKRDPVILTVSSNLQMVPWECLAVLCKSESLTPVCRSTSEHFTMAGLRKLRRQKCNRVDPKKTFYILNPGRDLHSTEAAFKGMFENQDGWSGIVGLLPTSEEMRNALEQKEILLYCGHGSGSRYTGTSVVRHSNCNAVVFLMGCNSAKLKREGNFEPQGVINEYSLAASPCVVGCLWSVTDKEIDRYLAALLVKWLEPCRNYLAEKEECNARQLIPIEDWKQANVEACKELLVALSSARANCKLRYLTGAAPTAYGLPVISE